MRLVLGVVVVPLLAFGGAIGYALAVADRLPSPMATHWNGSGQANGAMSLGQLMGLSLTIGIILWGLGGLAVVMGRAVRVRFRAERAAMAWCSGTAFFNASVLYFTIQANVDQPSWATAKLPAFMVLAMLVPALGGAAIGWLLAGPKPDLPAHELVYQSDTATVVARDLRDDEHPVWQGHLRSKLLLGLVVASVLLGVLLAPVSIFLTATFLFVAIVSIPLVSVTVIVDHTGLWIHFGPLGWPRKHVELTAIASAAADDILPIEWGGWGYRMMPGRSAVVLRQGPAIVLQLTDGRQFAVTVDDAPAGAALLEAYRRRG